MNTIRRFCPPILAALAALVLAGCGGGGSEPPPSGDCVIIDHNCVDLSAIPAGMIAAAKALQIHYAHTSHCGQIVNGLAELMEADSTYSYARAVRSLPTTAGVLCIFDGQESADYITPDLYWQSESGIAMTNNVLTKNPSITVSMFAWCTQMDGYDQDEAQDYLDQMEAFEAQYSGEVRFVYFTGNCDSGGLAGYTRHRNNEMIRAWVRAGNNRIIFDFGDLECWLYDGEGNTYDHSTYEYNTGSSTVTVPVRHSAYSTEETSHTTWVNCTNKARAFWWMLARIAGWSGK